MNVVAALLIALAQPAAAPLARVEPTPTLGLPPADWSELPPLRYRRPPAPNPEISSFVRDEIVAGRCAAGIHSARGSILSIDLAVLVTPAGRIRRIIPRAIDCPTVEQYARGVVSRQARGNIDPAGLAADTWFRTTMTFTWTG